MTWHNKVVWTQGMFLQPHHFQQEGRHRQHALNARVDALSPYGWGFAELRVDEARLALGQVLVEHARGVMPDGTPFSIPDVDVAPPPMDVPADVHDERIVLAVTMDREGVAEMAFDANSDDDALGVNANVNAGAGTTARNGERPRYAVTDDQVRDAVGDDTELVEIQTARLCLHLLREKDLPQGMAALGVVKVLEKRSDQQLVLDRGYVPPQVRIDATPHLASVTTLLHGHVRQRAQLLVSMIGQLSHGVSELADFLTLQALNRYEPVLRQLAAAPNVHPRELHTTLLMLAGDLATLASSTRRLADQPLYHHPDPRMAFDPLVAVLREMLNVEVMHKALQIKLEPRKYGVHVAVVPDPTLPRSAGFVLAVAAQLPGEQVRTRFPAQSCLAPAAMLGKLVNNNLPGIKLRVLPVAPRQLPFHAGHHYFELDNAGELWQQFQDSGSLALHVGGDFPGLEMQLWAIRK
jgi:type VI secretion system protein ImpJ